MSEQLAASIVRLPSFRELALEAIAESLEVHREETDSPAAPRYDCPDPGDLLLVAERQPGSVSLIETTRHGRRGRIENVGRAPHSIVCHRDPAQSGREAAAYVQPRKGR